MYLSRLILNPRNRAVQRQIANPYQLHRTVMSCFPTGKVGLERTDDGATGVLFRLEEDTQTNRLLLLVQSTQPPDWSALPADYLLPPDPFDPVGANPAVKNFDPALSSGQMLHFRLHANPTKRLGKSFGQDAGKRVGIYDTDKQFEWLQRKGEQGGFQVLSAMPGQDQIQKDTIERKATENNATHGLKFLSVRFDGLLQVTDPERFAETLRAGIGSGKAFSCGLLSIAPAR